MSDAYSQTGNNSLFPSISRGQAEFCDFTRTMLPPVSASSRTSPIRRLATTTTVTCASQATVYGRCILASYSDARKDMCAAEFAQFKTCFQTIVCPFNLFLGFLGDPYILCGF